MNLGAAKTVSVIVPAYNAQATIGETLDSVRSQTYSALEIIVVDDGSSDRTADIVRAHAAQDPRILLVTQANAGNAAARNMGFARSTGVYIASLDADDVWFPDKIARQVARMEECPRAGLVYCWSLYMDAEGYATGGYCAHREQGDVFLKLVCFNFVGNGSVPLMRREAVELSGGYRAYSGVEDMDLFLRIAPHYEFAVVPKILAAYRQTPGSMSRNKRRMEQAYAAMLADLKRRHPDLPSAVLTWSRGIFHSYLAAKSLDQGRPLEAVASFATAAAADPSVLLRALAYARSWPRSRIRAHGPHIRDLLAGSTAFYAPDAPVSLIRPSASPLGVLAPWRSAGLARLRASAPS